MTRMALAAVLAATAVQAEPVNLVNNGTEGDTATLHMESAALGVLTYESNAYQNSQNGTWKVEADGLTCFLSVRVDDDETASVYCDEGWQVEPRIADVADGEAFHFIITWMGG